MTKQKPKKKDQSITTVEDLLSILIPNVKKCDQKNASIEIWCEDQEYAIENISGFGFSPDVVIRIKRIKSPILKPLVFKMEHNKMAQAKIKEINKALSKRK